MEGQKGKFIISLDFEIYWGIRDMVALKDYQNHLIGVREVIPQLLHAFREYNVNATFATVGLLFFETREEMIRSLPEIRPTYLNEKLSPYLTLKEDVGKNEASDPYHFGWDLIKQILESNQEIGSHTFSHYYCQEPGQTKLQFEVDLRTAVQVAKKNNIELKSLVFPRNQFTPEYISILKEMGFTSYRGNQKGLMYDYQYKGRLRLLQRPLRLIDSYMNISGDHIYDIEKLKCTGPINIPASRLLRPYSNRLRFLENFRLRRILNSMSAAAKNNKVYHLWWHPHNFGDQLKKNMEFLDSILEHYAMLNRKYGFESMSMKQLAERLLNDGQETE